MEHHNQNPSTSFFNGENLFMMKQVPVNIPVLTCDYGEDIVDWFEDFEYETKAAGWDDKLRLARFPSYLKGTARNFYSFQCKDLSTYYELKQLMVKALCSKEYRSNLERKIFEEKQKRDQPVLSYIMEMQKLIQKYDLEMEEKNRVRLIKRNMLPEIQQYLDQFDFENLNQLIDRATKAEESYNRKLCIKNKGSGSPMVVEKMLSEFKSSLEAIEGKLASMNAGAAQRSTRNHEGSPPLPQRKPMTCHYCGKLGHKYRECRKRIYDESQNNKSSSQDCRKLPMAQPGKP